MVTWIAAAVVLVAGCGAATPATTALRGRAADGGEVVLYRDAALVERRIAVDVPASGEARVTVPIAAGTAPEDVFVIPGGGSSVTEVRSSGGAAVELAVRAPRAGRVALRIGYFTPRLSWDAAYTMIASPRRDRATLRGALVVHNTTGIDLRGVRVRLVDKSHGDAARLLDTWLGLAFGRTTATYGDPDRVLGRLDLLHGDTRADLLPSVMLPARAVLVYDPVGAGADHAGYAPIRDADYGTEPASPRVVESFEIARDGDAMKGLPAGPVRLLDRRAGGALALLGEGRLFELATTTRDTIPIGTAPDVSGRRERREFSIDDDQRRVVEEFVISIENKRPHAVEVVAREHLYRGQNWTLAYISVPVTSAAKEGPQQIAPRISVPARSTRSLMYVVVYTWEPDPPSPPRKPLLPP